MVDQRFAGVGAAGAHHRDRGVTQPAMILGRALRGRVGVFRQQVAGFVVDELDRFAAGGLDCQLPLGVVEEAADALPVLQGDAGAAGVVVSQGDAAVTGLVAAGVQGIGLGIAAALFQQAVAGQVRSELTQPAFLHINASIFQHSRSTTIIRHLTVAYGLADRSILKKQQMANVSDIVCWRTQLRQLHLSRS